jgi:hypothetical protein
MITDYLTRPVVYGKNRGDDADLFFFRHSGREHAGNGQGQNKKQTDNIFHFQIPPILN